MLKMRRTVAMSCRVHNYLLLLFLFSFGLYLSQLWWEVTPLYKDVVSSFNFILAAVSYIYGTIIILMIIILTIRVGMFPKWDFWSTVLRLILILFLRLLISLYLNLISFPINIQF